MRRVDRSLWPYLLLALVGACSLIVDFPAKPEASVDAGTDAKVSRDGAHDTGRDVGPVADAQQMTSCDPSDNARCGDTQLCCDRQEGNGPSCIDTIASSDCSACNVGCSDAKAPNCGGRTCECEAGSGQACPDGQRCDGTGDGARCVECSVDADCAARSDGLKQCVSNKCVECDRGALANDPSDDQGCTPALPICNSGNQCTGCSTSPNNCPSGMQCNPQQGCSGCRLDAPISANGCGGTSPICGSTTIGGAPAAQCRKCANDSECGVGYCVEATGECVSGCDPDQPPIANGCAAVTPICVPNDTGYSCKVCTAASDCSKLTATPLCATSGTQSGQCVQCRNNGDCDQTGATPVCSMVTSTCKARTMADCTGLTPYFEPTSKKCVQCITAANCVGNTGAAGPVCTAAFTCAQCTTSLDCPASAPTCNPLTNMCVPCTIDAECPASRFPATPHCNAGACAACSDSSQCPDAKPICSPAAKSCVLCNGEVNADALCAQRGVLKSAPSPFCITTDPAALKVGQCGVCDAPNRGCSGAIGYCDVTDNACVSCVNSSATSAPDTGCPAPGLSQCLKVATPPPAVAYGCYACDPSQALGMRGCAASTECCAAGSSPACPLQTQCVPIVSDAGI
ncbi:MAG: hypothetical protein JWN04_2033 [Myxococcaceae bacterium]|nr:hypothetical protein [Myxococcaceae bacterium]